MATTNNQPQAGEPHTFPCHRCGRPVYYNTAKKKALYAVGDTSPDCWLDGIQGTHQAPPLKPWENVVMWVIGAVLVFGLGACYVHFDNQAKDEQRQIDDCIDAFLELRGTVAEATGGQRGVPIPEDEQRQIIDNCREQVRSGAWDG